MTHPLGGRLLLRWYPLRYELRPPGQHGGPRCTGSIVDDHMARQVLARRRTDVPEQRGREVIHQRGLVSRFPQLRVDIPLGKLAPRDIHSSRGGQAAVNCRPANETSRWLHRCGGGRWLQKKMRQFARVTLVELASKPASSGIMCISFQRAQPLRPFVE